jgi:UDP-galactopyranose mutase
MARGRRVFYVEEPTPGAPTPRLDVSRRDCGVYVVTPRMPDGLGGDAADSVLRSLLHKDLLLEFGADDYILWYYTPLAIPFTRDLDPLAVVYDCMDELSAFKFASQDLARREAELFSRADVVFTGGYSLYEAKRHLHSNIHPFPSSIDPAHFRRARGGCADPEDQRSIPRPRLGFFGVIDERMDLELLAGIADDRPDWHFVMVGPVVKIDPAELPARPNIHYLGGKNYEELPAYLSGWDVAMLPFARNESTRFISPTKTPEYLAAGVPTVSTSVRDVVRPYGREGLVEIADTVAEFAAAAERLIGREAYEHIAWLEQVDRALASNSWDEVWGRMMALVELAIGKRATTSYAPEIPAPDRRAGGGAGASSAHGD